MDVDHYIAYMARIEYELDVLVSRGNVQAVKTFLKTNPLIDINFHILNDMMDQRFFLTEASRSNHDAIVAILLAHPAIDVNVQASDWGSAFSSVCNYSLTPCFRLLLGDSRVNVNQPDGIGTTPLWHAAHSGHLDLIKLCVASGREMDLGTPGSQYTDPFTVAKMITWDSEDMKRKKLEIVSLLERSMENPEKTRIEVLQELGIAGELSLGWHFSWEKVLTDFL